MGWDFHGVEFPLPFPLVLTRSSLAARCTRSAREDLVGTDLRGSFIVSLHLLLKSGGKCLHFSLKSGEKLPIFLLFL